MSDKKAVLFPLGTVVQLKLSGAQKMVVGGAEVSITGTSYTCFWDNNVSTFPEAVLQRAESDAFPVAAEAYRLTEELGFSSSQLSEAVTFAIAEHKRACMLYRELCKLAGEDAGWFDEQVLLRKLESKLATAWSYGHLCDLAGCALDAGIKPEDLAKSIRSRLVLTTDQARHLRAWRTDYFDGGSGEVTTALVNVLKLRLWGHEIKEPLLKAVAEESSTLGSDTADLLETLVSSEE